MEAGKPFIFTVTAIVGMEGEMTLRISQQVTVDRLAMIFKVNFYLPLQPYKLQITGTKGALNSFSFLLNKINLVKSSLAGLVLRLP